MNKDEVENDDDGDGQGRMVIRLKGRIQLVLIIIIKIIIVKTEFRFLHVNDERAKASVNRLSQLPHHPSSLSSSSVFSLSLFTFHHLYIHPFSSFFYNNFFLLLLLKTIFFVSTFSWHTMMIIIMMRMNFKHPIYSCSFHTLLFPHLILIIKLLK